MVFGFENEVKSLEEGGYGYCDRKMEEKEVVCLYDGGEWFCGSRLQDYYWYCYMKRVYFYMVVGWFKEEKRGWVSLGF